MEPTDPSPKQIRKNRPPSEKNLAGRETVAGTGVYCGVVIGEFSTAKTVFQGKIYDCEAFPDNSKQSDPSPRVSPRFQRNREQAPLPFRRVVTLFMGLVFPKYTNQKSGLGLWPYPEACMGFSHTGVLLFVGPPGTRIPKSAWVFSNLACCTQEKRI